MAEPYYLAEWTGLRKVPVTSTNVASIAYSPDFGRLYVEFKPAPFPSRGTGSCYVYFDVPRDVWFGMLGSASKGKFVWKVLRDKYGYAKIW